MATSSKKKKNNNSHIKRPLKNVEKTPKRHGKKLTHQEDLNPYRFAWISIVFLFVAILLFISVISYFANWKADADLVALPLGSAAKYDVINSGGHIGLKCADYLVRELFGIAAILIPYILLLFALLIVRTSGKMRDIVRRRIFPSIILLCFSSPFLGEFFGRNNSFFGSGLGGEMGIYISEWIKGYLGEEGTAILFIAIMGLLIWLLLNDLVIWIGRKLILGITFATTFFVNQFRKYHARQNDEMIIIPDTEYSSDTEYHTATEYNYEGKELETIQNENTEIQEKEDHLEDKGPLYNTIVLDNGNLAAFITDDYYLYLDVDALTQIGNEGVIAHTEEEKETQDEIFVVTRGEDENDSEENSSVNKQIHKTDEENPKVIQNANPESHVDDSIVNEGDEFEDGETEDKETGRITSVQFDDLVISKSGDEEKVSDIDVDERTLYDPTLELSGYRKPTIDLLKHIDEEDVKVKDEEVIKNKNQIVDTLATFGIKISEIEATVGPTVTLYEIKPAPGVRISKIQNLEKDIALALAALGIRIIAPIPGKGTIGIEVPNRNKATVSMYSVIKSAKFHESTAELPIALGKTIQNETLVLDLAKMPHLLVAGATGQGKSVGLNAIITSLLYKKHPAEVKFVMVDPKRLELTPYAALSNHFMAQMEGNDNIILTDTEKVIYTLNSICKEMDDRYRLLEDAGVKNLKEYNNKFIHRKLNPEKGHRFLPYIVVIVDEFADLIMTAGREIELPIARIAQLARAAGIHMIIATQRPTTNIITGTIKANFPARMAFRVMSYIDSKTILDRAGADQLIGRGDMLIMSGNDLIRVQCAFVDTPEVEAITQFIGAQHGYPEPYQLPEYQPESDSKETSSQSSGPMQVDPLLIEVARYVVDNQIGSTSKVQRDFEVGFNRSARIFDQLEKLGIVGKQIGSKPRQVLISDPVSLEHILDRIR